MNERPALVGPGHTASLSVGRVMHSRRRPVINNFVYPTFYLTFNVARLDALSNRWFSVNRFNLLSLYERDHGARDGTALEPWARALLAKHGVAANAEIYLHCYPRLFGYAFNPVAFWYCYNNGADGRRELAAVIAEVSNTFGERHNYIVAHADGRAIRAGDVLTAKKCFHVSPFCDVKGFYRFRFDVSASREHVVIEYHDDEASRAAEAPQDATPPMGPLLLTSVIGWSRPLTPASIRDAVAGQPLMTFMLLARIHWQAARLWLKKVQFFTKPQPPLEETTR
jgi:uncharacterized protein